MKRFITTFSALLLAFTAVEGRAQLTATYDDISIPMSDGEFLEADVYIPSGVTSGEVILIQTPYNKEWFAWSLPMGVGMDLDAQPFIWVIVDWRGFYGSAGADVSDVDRGQDAYDVCDWIVAQAWHDERIGTWGPSALGGVQYQLIDKHHPNHVCAVPLVATGHQDYDSYFYGGVLEEARLYQLDALGYGLSPFILANHYDGPLWNFSAAASWYASEIDIPTLQIGGWYDHNIDKMIEFYESSRNDADPSVTDEQWLLVGPWVHGGTGSAYVGSADQGELTYPNAEFVSDTMAWEFLEYYLIDAPNGWNLTDKITYYEMGGNDEWWTSNEDNFEAVGTSVLYLTASEKLTSLDGAGSSSFVSDPSNPSPTIGGATLSDDLEQGPYDQNSLDARTDVITFSTAELNDEVSISGRVSLNLYISSDQPDCDIAVRLVDVYPDGRSMLITDGIQRMRFRSGDYTETGEEMMEDGVVYDVTIDLPFTNYSWLPGHKIKIYVSGNNASRFNVNLQDGGAMYESGTGNVANITVHHNEDHPSQIILPGENPTLSFKEPEAAGQLAVFPNPVRNELTISGPVKSDQSYELFDLSGKLLSKGQLNGNTLHTNQLESGMYMLRIMDENNHSSTVHFIKN